MRITQVLPLTIIPFLWGYIPTAFVQSAWLDAYYFRFLYVWEAAFILFWGWVGFLCGRLPEKPYRSILLGNATWLFSLGLYMWQFQLLDSAHRSPGFLSLLPQLFPFGVLSTVSGIITLFTRNITMNWIFVISYLCMLGVFFVGFHRGRRQQPTT
jgi:hypothetical protein